MGQMENSDKIQGERPRVIETSNSTEAGRIGGSSQGSWDSPGSTRGKESAGSAEDVGSTPELGGSPGEGNGNPLQCSGLENSTDRGAWRATVHRLAKSWTRL